MSKPISKTLLHGIRVNRLNLTSRQNVTSPNADFSILNYYNSMAQRMENGGNPYISDTVVSVPFEEGLSLKEGVHLHFILPIAFTHFTDDTSTILPVPNRWLIKKTSTKSTTFWLVESDFLSKTKAPNDEGHTTTILPLEPYAPNDVVYKADTQPFRYLGKQIKNVVSSDIRKTPDKQNDYWSKFFDGQAFTAFAYGDPEFASFYPNCKSVFGFHDPIGVQTDSYEIFGFYQKQSNENAYLAQINNLVGQVKGSLEELNTQCAQQFGFTFSGFDTLDKVPTFNGILFVNKQQQVLASKPENTKVKIAIGNDAGEAISAILATELSTTSKEKIKIENYLEAIQFDFLDDQKLDILPAFEAGRHARRFKTQKGTTYFDFSFFATDSSSSSSSTFFTDKNSTQQIQQIEQLLEENPDYIKLKTTLETLNNSLTTYHFDLQKIQSKQRLLHAHWQKYLACVHTPLDIIGELPDSNIVLSYIEKYVGDLQARFHNIGGLNSQKIANSESDTTTKVSIKLFSDATLGTPQPFEWWAYEAVAYATGTTCVGTKAASIIQCLKSIKGTIASLNSASILSNAHLQVGLTQLPGHRFYEPSEPTILLQGDELKNFADAQYSDNQAQLPKAILNPNSEIDILKKVFTGTVTLPDIVTNLPWIPLFMDWEVYFYPLDITGQSTTYDKNYLTNIFQIKPGAAEFSVQDNAKDIHYTPGVSAYQGRGHLSAYIDTYLKKKLEQLSKTKKQDAPIAFNKILGELNNRGFISHALSGFNHAFIQEKIALQLPIGDPIAFNDFKAIYKELQIAETIGEHWFFSPEANFDFNPIRGGGFTISKLHLITPFGQRWKLVDEALPNSKVIIPETMHLKQTLSFNGNALPTNAILYPRYSQPSAARTNWISAEDDNVLYTTNTPTNPVCGWLVPNNLEKSLEVYDAAGKHLGAAILDSNTSTVIFLPPPGQAIFNPQSVKNKHLKKFLLYIQSLKGKYQQFLRMVNDSLIYIDPENHAQHNNINYLIGRPMALLRMQLSFETPEAYACRQDWPSFVDMVNNDNIKPITSDFEKVEIPVRIGDYRRLNDGVVAFLLDGDDGDNVSVSCHSPIEALYQQNTSNDTTSDLNLKTLFYQSLADAPQKVTMLFDPRGSLHVATGIVPLIKLELPSRFYLKALQNLQVDFPITPAMMPRNKFQLNLPHEPGYDWTWNYKNLEQNHLNIPLLHKVSTHTTIEKAVYEATRQQAGIRTDWQTLLTEKILTTGVFGQSDRAYVHSDVLIKNTSISEKDRKALIQLFTRYGEQVDPMAVSAQFGQNELREGWLELTEQAAFVKKIYEPED